MSAAPKKSYFELAKEAILALKERGGSSQQAIKSWIISKYPTLNFAQVGTVAISIVVTLVLHAVLLHYSTT